MKAVYCHPAYLTFMHSISWEMPGWWSTSWNQDCQEKYQQPQICRWHHPYGRKQRGTSQPLDESVRGEWKGWLKMQHSKNKIMASSLITSWGTKKTVTDYLLGLKITADGDCSHEIKRRLLLRRKAMTNLDNVLKSRDITLPTKIHRVEAMVFAVVMYRCESWIIRKAEHQRTDAFKL